MPGRADNIALYSAVSAWHISYLLIAPAVVLFRKSAALSLIQKLFLSGSYWRVKCGLCGDLTRYSPYAPATPRYNGPYLIINGGRIAKDILEACRWRAKKSRKGTEYRWTCRRCAWWGLWRFAWTWIRIRFWARARVWARGRCRCAIWRIARPAYQVTERIKDRGKPGGDRRLSAVRIRQ